MSSETVTPSSRSSQRIEALLLALVGWVPLSPGFALRRILYRFVFQQLGSSVHLQPGVEFLGADQIELGNQVTINRGARLNASGSHSKILLSDRVQIDIGVDIRVSRGDCLIEIGPRTSIGPYTCIAGPGNIKIGQDCLIAAHVGIFANNHEFADRDHKIREQGVNRKGITIGDDCWLGSGVKVLDGVNIGEGSVIGAGAVVTKDIPPYSVAVGVPARIVAQRGAAKLTSELIS